MSTLPSTAVPAPLTRELRVPLVTTIALNVAAAGTVLRFPEYLDYPVQPSHFVTALLPAIVLLVFGARGQLSRPTRLQMVALASFFVFFLIDLVHFLRDGLQTNALATLIFWPLAIAYVYALSIPAFLPYLKVYARHVGIWITLSLLAAGVELAINFPTRPSGLSGSPNHLALQIVHFQMINIALGLRVNFLIQHVLGLLSLSRGYVVYLFISLLTGRNGLRLAIVMAVLALAALPLLGTLGGLLGAAGESFLMGRFDLEANSSDSTGRGMLRVLLHPEYLIIGAGEQRINYEGDPFPGQIHNNFLAMSFCFGVVGIAFACWFLHLLRRRVGTMMALAYFVFSLALYFFNNIAFLALIAALVVPRSKSR